jgi:hypothetical protein
MIGKQRIVILVGGLAGLLVANTALAAVINVDFAASGGDATHSGSDGVLSGGGTVWNGVLFNTTVMNVANEGGTTTPIDVVMNPFFSSFTDVSSTNDLQDSGTVGGGFDVADLIAGNSYDLAVYGGAFLSFGVTDASGTTGGLCTVAPTYVLPGTAGSDYCTFSGLMPFDLGGGVMGIRVLGLDGLVTGFQIEGTFETVAPSVPALGPLGVLFLALSLCGVSVPESVARRNG